MRLGGSGSGSELARRLRLRSCAVAERRPGEGPGATWDRRNPWAAPALQPDRRIDYVLTGWPGRGGRGHVVAVSLAGTEPVDGVVPSDHYAVVADLRY